MNLQAAPAKWEPGYQNKLNAELAREDRRNRKAGTDIELTAERLIIKSPDGSRFALTVSNAGVLSATAL